MHAEMYTATMTTLLQSVRKYYVICVTLYVTQVAAVDGNRYGNLGEQSGLCGRRVQITNIRNDRVRPNSGIELDLI